MENLTIKTGMHGSLHCFFTFNGQEYCADVSAIPFLDFKTICSVFRSEGGEVVDWTPVFTRKDVPVTADGLRECVAAFVS